MKRIIVGASVLVVLALAVASGAGAWWSARTEVVKLRGQLTTIPEQIKRQDDELSKFEQKTVDEQSTARDHIRVLEEARAPRPVAVAPPAEGATAATEATGMYTVKEGDGSLWNIAMGRGVSARDFNAWLAKVKQLNDGLDVSVIVPGVTKLKLPATTIAAR